MSTISYTFTVTGMHRGSCSLLIGETIEETPGVHRSQSSVRAGRTVVDADPAVIGTDALATISGSLGYAANSSRPDLLKDR